MATLSVQEAMGFKVDREAVANLVLPQLWAMSMGPRKSPLLIAMQCCRHYHALSAECGAIPTIHACDS